MRFSAPAEAAAYPIRLWGVDEILGAPFMQGHAAFNNYIAMCKEKPNAHIDVMRDWLNRMERRVSIGSDFLGNHFLLIDPGTLSFASGECAIVEHHTWETTSHENLQTWLSVRYIEPYAEDEAPAVAGDVAPSWNPARETALRPEAFDEAAWTQLVRDIYLAARQRDSDVRFFAHRFMDETRPKLRKPANAKDLAQVARLFELSEQAQLLDLLRVSDGIKNLANTMNLGSCRELLSPVRAKREVAFRREVRASVDAGELTVEDAQSLLDGLLTAWASDQEDVLLLLPENNPVPGGVVDCDNFQLTTHRSLADYLEAQIAATSDD